MTRRRLSTMHCGSTGANHAATTTAVSEAVMAAARRLKSRASVQHGCAAADEKSPWKGVAMARSRLSSMHCSSTDATAVAATAAASEAATAAARRRRSWTSMQHDRAAAGRPRRQHGGGDTRHGGGRIQCWHRGQCGQCGQCGLSAAVSCRGCRCQHQSAHDPNRLGRRSSTV